MLPQTVTATGFWELVESLPEETEWAALRSDLERRLLLGSADAPTLTDIENRLLVALRVREDFLQSPLYAGMKTDKIWWASVASGAGARRAAYPTK